MKQQLNIEKNKRSKILLVLSMITLFLAILFKNINIYKYAVVGAASEMLWLFIIASIFIIPGIALWFLLKKNYSFKRTYLYILLISATSIVFLFY